MRKVLVIIFISFCSILIGQESVGQITYKIDFSSEDEQLKATLGFLQGYKMVVYYQDQFTRSEMSMGSMMTISTITDSIGDVVIVLMDGINGKTALKSPMSEMEQLED